MYYTREQLRDFIKCPQLGSTEYGAWGALRLEQRLAINSMLDQLDSADAYIRQLEKENEELKNKTQVISPYYVSQNYIPKSVIREKIEETEQLKTEYLEEYGGDMDDDFFYDMRGYNSRINILKEILGEKDDNRNKI